MIAVWVFALVAHVIKLALERRKSQVDRQQILQALSAVFVSVLMATTQKSGVTRYTAAGALYAVSALVNPVSRLVPLVLLVTGAWPPILALCVDACVFLWAGDIVNLWRFF